MVPVTLAKSVSSLPRPTFAPGLMRVPRWRTMMVPPGTSCPPKAFTPRRCALESRPFLELPKPFLCAITNPCLFFHGLNALLFLFAFGGFLCCALLGSLGLGLRFGLALGRLCRSGLPFSRRLCLFRPRSGQVGSGKALAIESDLGDPYRSKRLAMSVNLLVLLFALEVEDQDLVRTAALHHLSADDSASAWANSAFLARHGQNVIKFNHVAVGGGQLLNFHYVAGCDAVLFPPGANYRVHKLSPSPLQSAWPERTYIDL